MNTEEIREALFRLRDEKYRELQIRTIPTLKPETVIGVRTPELRKMARELARAEEIRDFLRDLPHQYFEENQLHAFILSGMKDYEQCIDALNLFLPYVDNWATCDQMSPGVFRKHRPELLKSIRTWILSGKTYTVRFGIVLWLPHFLG